MASNVALFGEAEKGKHRHLHFFSSLPELANTLGNPTQDSQAIHLAVQILLFEQNLIFYKIEEEGFSKAEYLYGMQLLKKSNQVKNLSAICLPGVGDKEILDIATNLCLAYKAIIITSEKDFYDYMTH